MQAARVIGRTHATTKHVSLANQKLIIVQPLLADGTRPDGPPQIAFDRLGAGIGQTVMLTSDAVLIRELTGTDSCPARWSVCGLIDRTS
jgi:ethanolamine utilization protein EutN